MVLSHGLVKLWYGYLKDSEKKNVKQKIDSASEFGTATLNNVNGN